MTTISGTPSVRALAALAVVLALGGLFNADGAFFHWNVHADMLRQIAVAALLALGMTLVIITGGIDLAVGSVLGLCAVVFSLLSLRSSAGPLVAVLACLGVGALTGAGSGALVARFGVQPFIATLAMMVFARGIAKSLSDGQKVTQAIEQPDGTFSYTPLPEIYSWLDRRVFGDTIAVVTLVALGAALACWLLLSQHRWGRHAYAVGGNEEAARLSGVRVQAVKVAAYALSGALAAIAGICQAVQEQQGDPEAGMGYELSAIAIAVIGGNSLAGGRGGVGLTLIGAVTIGYLEKILSINAVPEATRLMLTGVIVIAAVLLQRRGS